MKGSYVKLKGKTILVVDDESDLCNILADSFELLGLKTFRASNGKEAFAVLQINAIDFILSDVRMSGGDGLALLAEVRKLSATKPIFILMTGYADITREDALQKGAAELFHKPFPLEEVFNFLNASIIS